MRGLTAKQKKLIREEFKRIKTEKAKTDYFSYGNPNVTKDDFSYDFYEKVDEINPCEIFYQNFNHYVEELNNG